METNEILSKLRETTNDALKKQKEEMYQGLKKEKELKILEEEQKNNLIKIQAQEIFNMMTEQKMFTLASKGFSVYPILYIGNKRLRNKKDRQKKCDNLIDFLVQIIEENKFEPVRVYIHSDEITEYFLDENAVSGKYLAVRW